MNKLSLFSFTLFAAMTFTCGKSIAQTQNNQNQQNQTQTDPNAQPVQDPNYVDPYAMTIDSTGAGTTTPEATPTTTTTTTTIDAQPAERIRLYSGKHDGNNVINPGPKQ